MKVKRFLICLLLLVFTLPMPAHADIIWEEPLENEFYYSHQQDCTYLGRWFQTNGPSGSVTLWSVPNSKTPVTQLENGTELYIDWLYGNWGCVTYSPSRHEEFSGWVNMSEMSLLYDYICFQEEYAEQIKPYQGEFSHYSGDADGVSFYEYPGAPEAKSYFDGELGQIILERLAKGNMRISSIFVDENGLTWGFVNSLSHQDPFWFCLDNPPGNSSSDESFPVREVTAPTFTPPGLPLSAQLPYILVTGVVLVTTGLLFFLYYGKKKRTISGNPTGTL